MRLVRQVLNASIADGIIALNPADCHHFNTGITLDLRTASIPSVPEPASFVLLGSGLALARRYRQRSRS
jgi:hypothetical protein